MIFFSNDAQKSIDELFKFPYRLGTQLQRYAKDMGHIMEELKFLPSCTFGTIATRNIPNIGIIKYMADAGKCIIIDIDWSTTLTSFYSNQSNFITFTSDADIPSAPPSYYKEVFSSSFNCDNDFKVVMRKVRLNGTLEIVYNFMNPDGKIVCDIDFMHVLPFAYRDDGVITASGYAPNRMCYRIYEDGIRVKTNESRNVRLKSLIKESVDRCFRKYIDEMG